MFLVDASQRRTRQPDAYCRPNPAWALRILISGRDLVDVANDAQGTFAGGGQTLPTRGLHHAIFDGVDDSVSFPSNPRYNIGALTLVWVGYVADYANSNMLVARAAGNGGLYNPFELRVDQTTGKLRLTRADGSGHATWVTGSAVGTGLLSVALTHVPAGAVPELVINGSRVAMSHDFGVLSNGATNTEPLYLGRRADGNYHKGGTALLGAIERLSSLAEITALSTNPWQLYADRRIWIPMSVGGSATHDTTGALVGSDSVIAGTAERVAVHVTSGVLAGSGASTVGSAARTREHATTGVTAGAGGVVSGTAVHNIPHATSGALAGSGAVTAGSAARATSAFEHATSGDLAGAGATVAGTAARVHVFSTTGALAGAGGVVAGVAAHVAVHGTSGALAGGGGQLAAAAAGSGAAELVGLAGGFDVDYEPTLWWQRKPKRIKPEEAKKALQAVAKVVKEKAEEHAAERDPVAQRRADVKQAVAPLVSQMPGFDWRPIYDEAYDRALTAAIAQQMREQEAAQQMEQAIRRARLIDDEEVALLAAML